MAGNYGDLDRQISTLIECKPLSEKEVRELCEKVFYLELKSRRKRF